MKTYYIQTDAGSGEVEATSLNAAIADYFDGEIKGATNLRTLREKFKKYVKDGGWCFIDENGERVVEIGTAR